jgi:hypothetical protein
MRAFRVFAAVLAGVLLSLSLVGVAAAGQGHHHHHHGHPGYPPVFNGISASPGQVCVGGKVTIKAQTFKPYATVSYVVKVDGKAKDTGTVTANKKGVAQWQLKLTNKGTNRIGVWGPGKTRNTLTLAVSVTVKRCHYAQPQPSETSQPSGVVVGTTGGSSGLGGLLRTGAMVGTALALIVAVIAGLILLFSGLRKRRSDAGTPAQPA